jgi:4-amino-4-deoxy-L-arabinose transferase-like glycosyltransferase
MNNNIIKILSVIFILALFLRLLAVFSHEGINKMPTSDAKDYDEIAVNLKSGNGFSQVINGSMAPVVYRTPAYPLFLAGIYSIFGHNYTAVKVIQAIIGALFCILIFFITNMIYDNLITGLIASVCTAFYKPFISGFSCCAGPALLLSEYLYIFMIGLAVLSTACFIKNGNIKIGIISGIFMGLTILTRPEFALFPVLLIIYLVYTSRLFIITALKKYFIVYLFMILTILPWAVRNYIVFKEFIPLSTTSGVIFYVGNNSSANGGMGDAKAAIAMIDSEAMKNLSDKQRSGVFFKMGIKELKNNPKRIPKLFIRKILVHWAPFEDGFKIFNPFYAVVLFFGSIGILFFRKKVILENILLIALLTTTLTAIIAFGDPRYRYPYDAYLIIFAALASSEIIKKIKWGVLREARPSLFEKTARDNSR